MERWHSGPGKHFTHTSTFEVKACSISSTLSEISVELHYKAQDRIHYFNKIAKLNGMLKMTE